MHSRALKKMFPAPGAGNAYLCALDALHAYSWPDHSNLVLSRPGPSPLTSGVAKVGPGRAQALPTRPGALPT